MSRLEGTETVTFAREGAEDVELLISLPVGEVVAMSDPSKKYKLTISRSTIDKLGIKLYDKVSAVLSELIANAYDADAEEVTITLPTSVALSRKDGVEDRGFEIRMSDDGCGMTTDEVNRFYLNVGVNRRAMRGTDITPKWHRKVMGRKGIGKLAPFGICREIEVVTAGGEKTGEGYRVSNLILRYEDILSDSDDDYFPDQGPTDGNFVPNHGTTIILRKFEYRRVPSLETIHRQLAARFGLQRTDWRVFLVTPEAPNSPLLLGKLPIDTLDARMELDDRPVPIGDMALPVTGWVAYSKDPYKDENMAGVRIFARGKLVAQTRDFDVGTGFTGEFKLRSYLVGEVHANWLDEDEDMIRSDRQDILWNSEKGEAFQAWGRALIKELAARSEPSLTSQAWQTYLNKSDLIDRLDRFTPKGSKFRDSVIKVAKILVSKDRELVERDPDYVRSVTRLALSVGPYADMIELLHRVATEPASMQMITALFDTAAVAETLSLGQVAAERVNAINQLRKLIMTGDTAEKELQLLIESTPWIIAPQWTPLSKNRTLSRVRAAFESWYEKKHGEPIATSSMNPENKRPDFILLNSEGFLEVVEIKRPAHGLTDGEARRAIEYLLAVETFVLNNPSATKAFPACRLTIVCDKLELKDPLAIKSLEPTQRVRVYTWEEVLYDTMRAHEDFLAVVEDLTRASAEAAAAMNDSE